jgi:hypothetical protein
VLCVWQIAANEAKGIKFPLAHRLLDRQGFQHNSTLESVLTQPHEVCLLLQKHQGVGLSLGFQLETVIYEGAIAERFQLVFGQTKEGEWREVHAGTLPSMFRTFRRVFAEELNSRFGITTTPSRHILLALAMDPSQDTSAATGRFSQRSAAQQLLEGEYRRALRKRQIFLQMQKPAAQAAPAQRTQADLTEGGHASLSQAPARAGGKRPAGVLSLLSKPSKALAAPVLDEATADEAQLEAEIKKFQELAAAEQAAGDESRFMEKGLYNQGKFWWANRAAVPIHYHTWAGGVGSMKASSANVETTYSGAGRMMTTSKALSGEVLSDYAFVHENLKHPWLVPSNKEILSQYVSSHGKVPTLSDHESSSESSESSTDPESAEEGASGDESDGGGDGGAGGASGAAAPADSSGAAGGAGGDTPEGGEQVDNAEAGGAYARFGEMADARA